MATLKERIDDSHVGLATTLLPLPDAAAKEQIVRKNTNQHSYNWSP